MVAGRHHSNAALPDPVIQDSKSHAEQLIQTARAEAAGAERVGMATGSKLPVVEGYNIVRQLRRGGQGVVFESIHEATGRRVALKVMHDGPVTHRYDTARFQREVRILASLNDPGIVTLHDGGIVDGRYFLVMDFIEGESLDEYVARTPMEFSEKLALFVEICRSVSAAHVRGIVHRDLKPGNIRVDADGRPHILDFGLAKIIDLDNSSGITVTDSFVGSLPWAVPEQVMNESGCIDVRTDVYALGLILFYMLTGARPYETVGSMRCVMHAICEQSPERPSVLDPRVPSELDAIVLKCLNKEQERRYQSSAELAADVKRFLAGEPVEARGNSTWYVLLKVIRRHRVAAAGLAAAVLFTGMYAIAMTMLYDRAVTAERQAIELARDSQRKLLHVQDTLSFTARTVGDKLRHVTGAKKTRALLLQRIYGETQALLTEYGDDPQLRDSVARTEMELADIAHSLGHSGDAQVHFRNAQLLRQSLASEYPQNDAYAAANSIALVRLGDMAKEKEELQRARQLYEQALAIDETVVQRQPDNLSFVDQLLWSYDRLSVLSRTLGDTEQCGIYTRKQWEIGKRLVRERPDHAIARYGLYAAESRMAELSSLEGDKSLAEQFRHDALSSARTMVALDGGNMLLRRRLVAALGSAANLALKVGDHQRVKALLTEAQRQTEFMDDETIENLVVKLALHRRQALAADARSDFHTASSHASRGLSIARRLRWLGPTAEEGWTQAIKLLHFSYDLNSRRDRTAVARKMIIELTTLASELERNPTRASAPWLALIRFAKAAQESEPRAVESALASARSAAAQSQGKLFGPLYAVGCLSESLGRLSEAALAHEFAVPVAPRPYLQRMAEDALHRCRGLLDQQVTRR